MEAKQANNEYYVTYIFECEKGHQGTGRVTLNVPENAKISGIIIKMMQDEILRDAASKSCNGRPPPDVIITNIINLSRLQ